MAKVRLVVVGILVLGAVFAGGAWFAPHGEKEIVLAPVKSHGR